MKSFSEVFGMLANVKACLPAMQSHDVEEKLQEQDKDMRKEVCFSAEAQFQAEEHRKNLWWIVLYILVQVVYLICYSLAAAYHKLNYVPLVADSIMLMMHCGVAIFYVVRKDKHHTARTFLGIVLVIDAVLFGLSDPVVEKQAQSSLGLDGIIDFFGGVPPTEGPSLPHPYKSNSVFQFHMMYMTLFVMPFNYTVIYTPICLLVYASIVVTSYHLQYVQYRKEGLNIESDQEDIIVEFGIMFMTLFFIMFAKRMLERSQRPIFFALELQKQQTIQQKVMRCRVEFEKSHLQDMISQGKQMANEHVAGPKLVKAQKVQHACGDSVISAPAILSRNHSAIRRSCKNGKDGDCLPSDALVWVQGESVPKKLGDVQPGQHVLCYDGLLRTMKFSLVQTAQVLAEEATPDWVKVTLQDGTLLEMTADHPVETHATELGGPVSTSWKLAGDLLTDVDSLMVLRAAPVPVQSLERTAGTCLSVASEMGTEHDVADISSPDCCLRRRWVTLGVQQPERHTVFVAQQGGCLHSGSCMAVGSADINMKYLRGLRVKDTFLHYSESMTSGSSRRTVSAPCGNDENRSWLNQVAPGQSLQRRCDVEERRSDIEGLTTSVISYDICPPEQGMGVTRSLPDIVFEADDLPISPSPPLSNVAESCASSALDSELQILKATQGGRRRQQQRMRKKMSKEQQKACENDMV